MGAIPNVRAVREAAGPPGKPPVSSLVLVGASFRTAGIETRERIAKRLSGLPGPVLRLEGRRVFESVTVETCNRIEVYFVGDSPDKLARSVATEFGSSTDVYVKTGLDAIIHIFRVASGLDSPVLGEEQILDQVRKAGRTARSAGQAKSILSSLFDAAYSSGRRVRESYRVPPENSSVGTFALSHALTDLGRRPASVLLIGSGETAKMASLKLKGSTVYLLSARPGAEARFPNALKISRRRLREVSGKVDLIIAATRHRGYVISKRDLPRKKRMTILDLGFPRNVDPSVKDSKFIRLYDLDAVAGWGLAHRHRMISSAEHLVNREARRFEAWLRASRLTPTLANIYRWAERIREEETFAALRRLPRLSMHDRTVVEALSRRLTGKLLSPHATFVKEVGSEEDQSQRLLLLRSIFTEGEV